MSLHQRFIGISPSCLITREQPEWPLEAPSTKEPLFMIQEVEDSEFPKRDPETVRVLQEVSVILKKYGRLLACHKDKQLRQQKRAKVANYLVGGFVMIFGFVSGIDAVKQHVGAFIPVIFAVLGASFLLLEAYTPSFLDDPNPERFGDYSRYLFKYSREIDRLLQERRLAITDWNARAWLLYEWARFNIDDSLEKWPWLDQRTEQEYATKRQSRLNVGKK